MPNETVVKPQKQTGASVIKPGRTCWKSDIGRATLLIDGQAYFQALYHTMIAAQETILILGWDINSRIALVDESEAVPGYPHRLLDLLQVLVQERPSLRVYILIWNYSTFMAINRENFQKIKLDWLSHERITFAFDDQHPIGGCHHQKCVVVDDKYGFCGGIDLTAGRWDTHNHRIDEPRRVSPDGDPQSPFHDIQGAVCGLPARHLGALVRRRWQRYSNTSLPPFSTAPLPGRFPFDEQNVFERVPVGIARTEPHYKALPAVKEVETAWIDLIRSAREYIYIENQYFTAEAVVEELNRQLRKPAGPEIIIILPRNYGGWLEEQTLGAKRRTVLGSLFTADRHGRLTVYYAASPAQNENVLVIHSKLLVADDRYIRIGSSNLSDRSMGLDTECDLLMDVRIADRPLVRKLVGRLWAGFLQQPEADVLRVLQKGKSLRDSLERLYASSPRRMLVKADPGEYENEGRPPVVDLADPAGPNKAEEVVENILYEPPHGQLRPIVWIVIALAVSIGLGLWLYSRGIDRAEVQQTLVGLLEAIRTSSFRVPAVLGIFIISGFLFIPITILIVGTAGVFGPAEALVFNLAGTSLNATACYLAGRGMGTRFFKKHLKTTYDRFRGVFNTGGYLSVIMIRFMPMAHFTVISMLLGAIHVRYIRFLLGTMIGLLPGILTIFIFQKSLSELIQGHKLAAVIILACGWGALIWVWIMARKRIQTRIQGGEVNAD